MYRARILDLWGVMRRLMRLGVAQESCGEPEAVVLVCCVELCSLHFAYGWEPERLVANALFGDGAAAAVVGNVDACGDGCWEIRRRASLLLGGSADAMRWRIGDHGFEMTLSAELPGLVGAKVRVVRRVAG